MTLLSSTAREAWCESEARPVVTVLGAWVDGDPANDAVVAAARDIAEALHIERASQARRWAENTQDDYEPPPANELADAVRELYELCPGATPPDALSVADANVLRQAATTLARVTGEHPDHAGTLATQAWPTYVVAAQHAAACTSPRQDPEHVSVTVFADRDRRWTLYANGIDVGGGVGDETLDVLVQPGQRLHLHARCGNDVRCSRAVRLAAGTPAVGLYIDAIGSRLHGRMAASSLSLAYRSAADRNRFVARDAAIAASVLAALRTPAGDALTVLSEGPDLRLVLSNHEGVAVQTLRASRDTVVAAAQRLVAGDSEPATGAWQPGKHRVVVETRGRAPNVIAAQSTFDRALVPTRPYCTAGRCAFAAPPGTLRMRFAEEQATGPLEKTLDLDGDLLVRVRPGRRYWAKYTGLGLIGLGSASMTVAFLSGALESAIAKAGCDARPSEGPDNCDDSVAASRWQAAAFFGGAGTVLVGSFLYFVVHKKPRINVSPLGGSGLAF